MFVIIAVAAFCYGANATTKTASAMADSIKMGKKLKDHVCTSACKNGKHVYAHGEKGHVCTDACKKIYVTSLNNKTS